MNERRSVADRLGRGGAGGRPARFADAPRRLAVLASLAWVTGGCAGSEGPSGVTVSDSAGVVIVESSGPVWTEGEEWSILPDPDLVVGAADSEGPPFAAISDAEFLVDGLAVVDGQSSEVLVFDEDGLLRLAFGGEGDGPGEFRAASIARSTGADELFVYDRQLRRASWFRPSSGELLRTVALAGVDAGDGAPPGEVLPLSDGFLAARDGSDLTAARGTDISRDTSHFAVVSPASLEARVVARLPGAFTLQIEFRGNAGIRAQPLTPWPSWDVAADTLFVTSGERFVVRKIISSGLAAVFRRADRPRPVDDRAVAAFREAMLEPVPSGQRAMLEPMLDLLVYPERTPAYSKLLVDPERFVWAEHPGPLGRSPGPSWDVYAPTGEYLGVVSAPSRAELIRVGTEHVLAVWRDELDVPYLHRYPLTRNE